MVRTIALKVELAHSSISLVRETGVWGEKTGIIVSREVMRVTQGVVVVMAAVKLTRQRRVEWKDTHLRLWNSSSRRERVEPRPLFASWLDGIEGREGGGEGGRNERRMEERKELVGAKRGGGEREREKSQNEFRKKRVQYISVQQKRVQ